MAVEKNRLKKEEVVKLSLIAIARQLGPRAKLPTVAELCKALNVSRSTLDRVFRQLESEHVLECRHGSGIFVSPYSGQFTVGIVFGTNVYSGSFSQFWAMLHNQAVMHAEAAGEETRTYFHCPSAGNPVASTNALRDDLQKGVLDGVIAAAVSADEVAWLVQWGKPVITLGKRESAGWVQVDEREAMRLHLQAMKLGGAKRVALVGTYAEPQAYAKEEDAPTVLFRAMAADAGIEYNKDLRWFRNMGPPSDFSQPHEDFGAALAQEKFGSRSDRGGNAPVDGVVCLDDTIAHGLLVGLLRGGWSVGRDLVVSSGANRGSSLLRLFEQEIYRVEIDPQVIVTRLFDLLLRRLHGRMNGVQSMDFKPSLVAPLIQPRITVRQ